MESDSPWIPPLLKAIIKRRQESAIAGLGPKPYSSGPQISSPRVGVSAEQVRERAARE